MKLIEILVGEPQTKIYEFMGQKVEFKTLRQQEVNEIMIRIPRADTTMLELEKIPTLARAIVSLNNVPVEMFEEIREIVKDKPEVSIASAMEKILGRIDSDIINLMYGLYCEFREEMFKKREDLKNVSRNQSAEASINSANA